MKKLLALLACLMLLCASLVPACAEMTSAVTITCEEFMAAMETLAATHLNVEMSWISDPSMPGFLIGTLATNPVLAPDGDYVAMAGVTFTNGEGDDPETIMGMFNVLSVLVAAVPAVRDGVAPAEAPDLIFTDLQTMMRGVTAENPTVIGELYGVPAVLSVSQDEKGIVMSFMLLYNVPEQ